MSLFESKKTSWKRNLIYYELATKTGSIFNKIYYLFQKDFQVFKSFYFIYKQIN